MPTIIRERGFEVRIYTFDHPPPYVHVWKAGAVVKIDLTTHEAIEVVGAISDSEVKRAERVVARHAARLEREWTRIHGNE
jgi:Domain of unknown function (DUF4160)